MWCITSRLRLSQLLRRLSPSLPSAYPPKPISIAERNLLITPPFTLYPPFGTFTIQTSQGSASFISRELFPIYLRSRYPSTAHANS
jgi:hypothetical protein